MPTRILHTIDGCDSAIHISIVENIFMYDLYKRYCSHSCIAKHLRLNELESTSNTQKQQNKTDKEV